MKLSSKIISAVSICVFLASACNNSTNTKNNITPEDSTVNTTDHTGSTIAKDTSTNTQKSADTLKH